jgi:quercetin dioxygenase-like cupin family protein
MDMQYIARIDFPALEAAEERTRQVLLDGLQGGCTAACVKTPAGSGTPEGIHTHPVDQVFYILQGTLNLEIAGAEYEAGPGSVVRFPANTPHRNWNEGPEAVLHLTIKAPPGSADGAAKDA